MKRYIIIMLVLVALAVQGQAQKVTEYKVVKVVGKVEDPSSGKVLNTGDLILSSSKLKFATKDAYIVISSPETGRKKISGVPDDKSREIIDLLISFVEPDKRSTASRGGSNYYLETLQTSLTLDTLLILSPSYIAIDTQKLHLRKPAALKAWYSHNKKIRYTTVSDESKLHLGQKSIFGDYTAARYPRVIVEYYENENENPAFSPGVLIASFVPLYVNEQELAIEVRALLSSRPSSENYTHSVEEIRAYLLTEYADTQEDNLKQWLKEQGILSE